MATIRATALTTFALTPDGGSVSIGVADDHGEDSALVLPTSCLQALVMTLPEMAQQALCRKYGDPALRLVFPVQDWTVETTEKADRLILTFATSDGFRASFALFLHDLAEIANAALTGEATNGFATRLPAKRH
jgi:hypothetical protein